MGTAWSLLAVAPREGAVAAVEAAFAIVIAQMSQWNAASDLSRFNAAPPGQWWPIPSEFASVLSAARDIAAASDGAFDPGLGDVTERWGFGGAGPVSTVPDDAASRTAARQLDFDADARRIRRGEGTSLDLSGIAKGYAVDLAAERLLDMGVRHFLIEVGGELRGQGIRPDGQPWWVDVEPPSSLPAPAPPPWRIALHDLSVATSGNYRRGFSAGGRHYSHSFDPGTGRPIVHDVASVTVLHRRCMMADGWATALTVMGADRGIEAANRQGLAACIVAGGREHPSDAWRAMLT
ncbi:MAG: thiamine biosynthesis protein ApbE [Sphingopyxis macrogoltabida]|uniref:FAD:protein FMN transferase n=1 Tax=Sphingopyxis macrogoltabida TaxID=33050 RepID=A0A2W5MWJ7_SPHMC|nr:MAG: thiamine biosynthesis protein ApbE [Sphingopyxis macrogoltabida]